MLLVILVREEASHIADVPSREAFSMIEWGEPIGSKDAAPPRDGGPV